MSAVLEQKAIYDISLASRINSEPVIPELTEPLCQQAATLLKELLASKDFTIQPGVFQHLIDWYGKIIARLTNNLLIQRYSSFFLSVYPFWRPRNTAPGDCTPGTSREKLDAYIIWESEQNLFSGNEQYPELTRLLTLAQQNWLTVIEELFERIQRHSKDGIPALEELTAIEFGISDPHDHGRTASILTFGEMKMVYKPRSLDGEYGWNYILDHLMDQGLNYNFFLPEVLNFDGYGFMEFVDPSTCHHPHEVANCYEKYGAILAIAHAFGTYDLHHENIIVQGDSPVVIDAEPLFRCLLANSESGEKRLKLDKNISLDNIESNESVMDIGMLPHTILSQLDKDGNKHVEFIAGALHAFGNEPMKEYVFCGRGSDNLQLLEKQFTAATIPNLPSLHGEPQLPKAYLPEIEKGFRTAHQFLLTHRQQILYRDALLDQLRHLNLRLLLRPTVQYGVVFIRSISLQLLKSYEQRKQKILQDLKILGQLRIDAIDNIEMEEVAGIMDGDIPRFDVLAGSASAYNTTLLYSPVEMAKQRFERINEKELELQVATIKEKISEQSLRGQSAFGIIDSIVNAAIWIDDVPSWAYTAYAPGFGCTMVHADRGALYDGVLGTAVAIAEAGKLANNQRWMDTALKAIRPLAASISAGRGGGLARGLGGVIYGIIRIAAATNTPGNMQLARKIAVSYYKDVFAREELDEILHGRAGFLLAMIALYKRQPDSLLETIIEETAKTLIARSVSHDRGTCWKVMDGHSLPNISHGTSGMAMALARWYELSGDAKAREVLLGAMQYDNSFWEPAENGWADMRVAGLQDDQKTTWTWCNGRSGGLLSRLAVSQAIGTPFIDEYSAHALCASHTDILHETAPGLCCGTAGALDTLLKINEYHPSEHLQSHIAQATRLITSHTPDSHYSNLMPALFTGSAGLAFGMMRAAHPDQVQSMLWFG
ncbi:type 2 lanthipeptide synthetase LanM [Chitinophaga sp.]|uniref:type 2 lanthipeptide synthetase LanM n=1 Tax=Chitinophaga sp. TaxID=1869181 RepID=UPI0031D3750A